MARTRLPTRQKATWRTRRNPTTYKVVPDLRQTPRDPAHSEKIRKTMLSFLQEVLRSGLNSEVLDEKKLLEDLDNHQWSRQEIIAFVARHKMFWTGSDTVQSTYGTLNDIPPHTPYIVVGNQRKILQLPEAWVTTESERKNKQILEDRPSFEQPHYADRQPGTTEIKLDDKALKQVLDRTKVIATGLLKSRVGPFWYRMDESTKNDLIQSALEKWLRGFDYNRLSGRPSDETKQESVEVLSRATRDAWNESRVAKEREQSSGEQIERVRGVADVTPEELVDFRQTTNAQLDRMSLIDEIAKQPSAGATKANILRMHMGEQVLPHQPSSTIGRYGGNTYSGWTSKAYGHLFGQRWIFKVGGILYRPTGPEGTTPSYHGPPIQNRVVLIGERPMMILTRPRTDVRGKITLLPLDDSRQIFQIDANPLDLPLAPCPTCEDIARYLRIKGLTGPRVQQFIEVDFARMAREKGFDVFSTKET